MPWGTHPHDPLKVSEFLTYSQVMEIRKAIDFIKNEKPSEPLRLRNPEERKKILKDYVVKQVANGFRVEIQEDYSAVLVFGKNPNHILHLLLSIVTFGLWIFVWIMMIFFSKEKKYLFQIDDYGVITRDWLMSNLWPSEDCCRRAQGRTAARNK